MRIIYQHLELRELEEVHAARRFARRRNEGAQRRFNILYFKMGHIPGQRCRQYVLDVEPALPPNVKRHIGHPVDPDLVAVLEDGDVAILKNCRQTAFGDMLEYARVILVHTKEGYLALHLRPWHTPDRRRHSARHSRPCSRGITAFT